MEASPFPPHVCAHTIRRRLFPPFHPPFFTFLHPAANNLSPFRETNVAQNWEEMRTEEEEEEEEEEEATVLCIRTRSGIASFWSGKDWEIGCGRGGLFVPMCGPRMDFFFSQSKKGATALCNNGYSEYGTSSALGMQTRWALTELSNALICSAITNENVLFLLLPIACG